MSNISHKSWLKVTALVIGSFAPLAFLASIPGLSGPINLAVDLAFWPLDGAQSVNDAVPRFFAALISGFLVGWGITIWCLSGAPFDAAPDTVRRSVVFGILGWFILDSIGSIAAGAPLNALFNLGILGLAVGPLWRPTQPDAAFQS